MSRAAGRAATLAGHDRRQRWTLIATIIGSGAVFLDGTIVNVALKRIGQELPATYVGVLEGQAYVVSGYLAVLAALLILAGALSDHYGRRKRLSRIGLAGFAATSALCGLAPTLEWLVIFRLIQGAAGALLVPGSLSLITQAFAGAGARPRVRHLGGLDLGADGARADRRRHHGRHHRLAESRSSSTSRCGLRAVGDAPPRRGVARHRGDRQASTGSARSSRRSRSAGSRSASSADRRTSGTTRSPGSRSSSGSSRSILFPILMATRPNPLVPLEPVQSRAFATDQPRRPSSSTAPCT